MKREFVVKLRINGQTLELWADSSLNALELAGAIWNAATECENGDFEVAIVCDEEKL